ncbi:hypothetical protein [uncultured Chitinophaga sp.]|uniref:hypothetical protein n=1 Tax=uncultured Chitinophaga sp. TaxID=339340 RepID=UPI0025DB1207|nr:hypothetical protein [uncultured Chitinophaga sp.]
MEIICIFEKRHCEDALWAIKFHENMPDEFNRLFGLWNDHEYVSAFCEAHEDKLQSVFGQGVTVNDAVDEIIDEAVLLERQLYYFFRYKKLQEIFRPLHNNVYMLHALQQSKAAPILKKRSPALRIYALRMSANTFIITGGAIKMTRTMWEMEHLQKELRKLNMAVTWLKENGLHSSESLNDF